MVGPLKVKKKKGFLKIIKEGMSYKGPKRGQLP